MPVVFGCHPGAGFFLRDICRCYFYQNRSQQCKSGWIHHTHTVGDSFHSVMCVSFYMLCQIYHQFVKRKGYNQILMNPFAAIACRRLSLEEYPSKIPRLSHTIKFLFRDEDKDLKTYYVAIISKSGVYP